MCFFGVLFLIIGVISVLIGLFTLIPLVWGIPLTILGVIVTSAFGVKGVKCEKRAKIEVRICKIEFKREQGKVDPGKADTLIGKLWIGQAKYME